MPLPVRQKAIEDPQTLREDATYFRSGTVQVAVEVLPQRRSTSMGDLVLRGFVSDREIELVIPGRRKAAAVPLLQRLQARVQFRKLQPKGGNGSEVREWLQVDGAWRVRLLNAQDAAPDRRFQLIAARWRYRDTNGVEHVFGHLPGA